MRIAIEYKITDKICQSIQFAKRIFNSDYVYFFRCEKVTVFCAFTAIF
jgi:hypothetical protein